MARIEGLRKAFTNINRKIARAAKEAIADDVEKLEIAYKEERRKGINPVTGRKYRSLAKSTIERRKALARVNRTGKGFSPAKSNLTFSGQLIDSIRFQVLLRPLLTLIIDVTGNHKPYKGIRVNRLGKSTPNKTIAEGLAADGRPLIDISKKLSNDIDKRLRRALKRVFNT